MTILVAASLYAMVSGPMAPGDGAACVNAGLVDRACLPDEPVPPPDPEAPRAGPGDEIVVTAKRQPGEVDTVHAPVLRLDRNMIRSLGAPTLGKLLERMRLVARAPGGSEPVVLLNGRRIGGQDEIASLPPEAIEQMDVLPEPVAGELGYPANSRVINIITARRFTSFGLDSSIGVPTASLRPEVKQEGAGTLLRRDLRALTSLAWRDRPTILGKDPTGAGSDATETILPSERSLKAATSFAGPIAHEFNASLALNFERSVQRRLLFATGLDDREPDIISSRATAAGAIAMVQGFLGDWTWNTKFNYRAAWSGQSSAGGNHLSADGRSSDMRAMILATGPVVRLAAGSAIATIEGETAREMAASDPRIGSTSGRLGRASRHARIGMSLPLTPVERYGLTLGATLEALWVDGNRQLFGSITNIWVTPITGVQVSIGRSDRGIAPSLAQLSSPITVIPDSIYFDRVTARDVCVDLISGGNPDLRAERRRTLDIGVEVQPFPEQQLRFGATFSRVSSKRPIASAGASDPRLEAAFPFLYERDAAGNLLSISSMPVNLNSRRQRTMSWSISYAGELRRRGEIAEPPANADASDSLFAIITIDGSYRLEDMVSLAPGIPPLDLLDGAALEGTGGQPRFELGMVASLGNGRLGGSVSAQWRSPTRLRSETKESDLRFSGLLTMGMNIYANLELLGSAAWLRNLRLELSADNIFDQRQAVRDGFGAIPPSLGGSRLDPLGRTLTLSVRKLF